MMKERTNPKSVAPRKVKGTVLFTVVVVMLVLVVFLMGTLALAATASRRASNTYSTAQTQSTAKAGVNAIIAAMQNNIDVAYAAAKVDASNPVHIGEIKFSYMDNVVESEGEDPERKAQIVNSLGKVTDSGIEYVGKKWEVNEEGKLTEKDVIKVWATATQGTAESTYATYIMKDADPGGGGGGETTGFVATGSAVSENHTSVYGGCYIGFDEYWKGGNAPGRTPEQIEADAARAAQEWEDRLPMNKASDVHYNAKDAATIFEADCHVNGSYITDTGSDFHLVMKSPKGGMTVWGDLILNHPMLIDTVNVPASKYSATGINTADIPYIYVDGDLIFASGCANPTIMPYVYNQNDTQATHTTYEANKPGQQIPLNIFCGSMQDEYGDKHKVNINGDVYCYDATKTSHLNHGNDSMLYSWGAKVVNPDGTAVNHVNGNFYTKGSLELGGQDSAKVMTFNGDVCIDHDLVINDKCSVQINGNLMVGGMITLGPNFQALNVTGKVMCDDEAHRNDARISAAGGKEGTGKRAGATIASQEVIGAAVKSGYEARDVEVTEPVLISSETYALVVLAADGSVVTKNKDNDAGFSSATDLTISVDPIDPTRARVTVWGGDRTNDSVFNGAVLPAGCSIQFHYTVKEYEDQTHTVKKYYTTTDPIKEVSAKEAMTQTKITYKDAGGTALADVTFFPSVYEKDVILGKKLPDGTSGTNDKYKIIRTVPEIMTGKTDPYSMGVYSYPADQVTEVLDVNTSATSGTNWHKDGNVFVVTGSLTLTNGGGDGRPGVVVQAQSDKEIWIKLAKNLKYQAGALMVDDTGITPKDVNFFVEGNTNIGNGSASKLNGYTCLDTTVISDGMIDDSFSYLNCISIAKQFSNASGKYQIYNDFYNCAMVKSEYTKITNAEYNTFKQSLESMTDSQRAAAKIKFYQTDKLVSEESLTEIYKPVGIDPLLYPQIKQPIIHVYSDKTQTSSINMHNTCSIGAFVQAPYMNYNQSDNGGMTPKSTIYYNGFDIKGKDVPATQVGCYGCMIVKDFYCKNEWLMLYAGKSESGTGPVVSDALMRNWLVMYNDNY